MASIKFIGKYSLGELSAYGKIASARNTENKENINDPRAPDKVFLAANYELFSVFSKKITILFLDLILILSLFSIYYLKTNNIASTTLLYLVITICISSDIGGYVFGKIFKWKKFTKISPKKTISGVFGSFLFSLIGLIIFSEIFYPGWNVSIKYFLLTIFFSMVAQAGDLTISYFKRL